MDTKDLAQRVQQVTRILDKKDLKVVLLKDGLLTAYSFSGMALRCSFPLPGLTTALKVIPSHLIRALSVRDTDQFIVHAAPEKLGFEFTGLPGKPKAIITADPEHGFASVHFPDRAVKHPSITLTAGEVEWAKKYISYASTDQLRLSMMGLMVCLQRGMIGVSDAHLLPVLPMRDNPDQVKHLREATGINGFTIPTRIIEALPNGQPVTFRPVPIDKGNDKIVYERIAAYSGGFEAYFGYIEAPDFSKVYCEVKRLKSVTVQSDSLTNAATAALKFANPITSELVLSVRGNLLKVSSKDLDLGLSYGEAIHCYHHEADGEVFGFNGKYLLKAIKAAGKGMVTIFFEVPHRAFILSNWNNVLLMPLMVDKFDN